MILGLKRGVVELRRSWPGMGNHRPRNHRRQY